jgi:hypothetical protein
VDPPADRAAMLADVDHLADRRPEAYGLAAAHPAVAQTSSG